jgi:hypothetical protein
MLERGLAAVAVGVFGLGSDADQGTFQDEPDELDEADVDETRLAACLALGRRDRGVANELETLNRVEVKMVVNAPAAIAPKTQTANGSA